MAAAWAGQPVSMLQREAPQTGNWTWQFANRVPSRAKRSKLGVRHTGLPWQAKASALSSSGMKKTMFGRAPAAPPPAS